jgi:DNA-binding NtrC family response regulator
MARILAVDDQPHMTWVIANWLGKHGHEVVRAFDGAAAAERLRGESFDLLITDVDMPRMDGLSLLSERDAIDRLRGVVVLTGRQDYKELGSIYGKDKIHILPKPFSPSRLVQLVDKLLSDEHSPSAASDFAPAP